jgi:hypothetical protein
MIGAEGIIKSRMAGMAPTAVFINADGYSAVKVDKSSMQPLPDITILAHEKMSELDMRFLVEMLVIVDGFDHKRVTAVTQHCIAAKAKRVISNYNGWRTCGIHKIAETQRITDTEGYLTWESNTW